MELGLLELLVWSVIQLIQGFDQTLLHLSHVDICSGPDLGQLRGGISLQGSGLGAWKEI